MLDDPRQRNPIPQPPYTKPGLAAALTIAGLWLVMNTTSLKGSVSKDWGTALLVIGAAIAYTVVRWWTKPKGPRA